MLDFLSALRRERRSSSYDGGLVMLNYKICEFVTVQIRSGWWNLEVAVAKNHEGVENLGKWTYDLNER